jgi:hypothetical protein
MIKIFTLLFLLAPSLASAVIAQRQHAATIVDGKKILASDLNDEFDELVNAVNSIDSSNIVNGSLTAVDFAATSSAITLNKKAGCAFTAQSDVSGVKSISIAPPCEVFIDGLRGFITATQNISLLTNLIDGGVLATKSYYYVYASRNNASLDFHFSQNEPILSTTRKTSDANSKYVGVVRTCDATTDIVRFTQKAGNEFTWTQNGCAVGNQGPRDGLMATANNSFISGSFVVPNTFKALKLRSSVFVTGFPAQCEIRYNSSAPGPQLSYQLTVIATGGGITILPDWGGLDASNYRVTDISNCLPGGDFKVVGWSEPNFLHQ